MADPRGGSVHTRKMEAEEEDELEQDGADDERRHGGGEGGAAALIGRQQQGRGMRLLLVPLHGSGQWLCSASAGWCSALPPLPEARATCCSSVVGLVVMQLPPH